MDALGTSTDNRFAPYALNFYISELVSTIGMWIQHDKNISEEELASLIRGILKDGIITQLQ